MPEWIQNLLAILAIPEIGLSSLFLISLISATLLPLGSEPALVGLLLLKPELFWHAIMIATLGNTTGGAISWLMGAGMHKTIYRNQHNVLKSTATQRLHLRWLHRFGAKVCLLSWLPIVGDPICAMAGWLRLPFWPCLSYMLIGKFLRYIVLTVAIQSVIPT